MRVVIDTHIWISFLISGLLRGLDDLIIEDKITPVTCKAQLDELIEVLHRPKFRKHFSDHDIAEFLAILYKKASIVKIGNTIKACRDPKDNFILEIAVAGDAAYIVTGDQDLLELTPYLGKRIIVPAEFARRFTSLRKVEPADE